MYTEQEFTQAFANAKEALGCIAKFQTPPTPEVYEVWYRYAEGENEALRDALDYTVNDAKNVTKSDIEQLRRQFFATAETAKTNARFSDRLAEELGGLRSIVNEQLVAGGEFDSSLSTASENLRPDSTPIEMKACIELALSCNEEMQGQLQDANRRLVSSQKQIDEMRECLLESQKMLLIDPVTQVGNRLFFDRMMAQVFNEHRPASKYRFLLIVDLDKFKKVNDTLGHAAGDVVLHYVAQTLQMISNEASVARYGGDEFAVFFESDNQAAGKTLGEEIREHFATNTLKVTRTAKTASRVTTSIGIARLRADDSRETWFNRADKLLYGAKQSGRNQVMIERDLSKAMS